MRDFVAQFTNSFYHVVEAVAVVRGDVNLPGQILETINNLELGTPTDRLQRVSQ
jgi:hypothetical protein